MKKLFLAVITAMALVAGPIAITGPANAAPPYTGTVAVEANVQPVKRVLFQNQHPRVRFSVKPIEGAGKPRGNVFITIKSKGVNKIVHRRYRGHPTVYTLPKLKGTVKGKRYTVRTQFFSPNGSVYKNDADRTWIKVKKRRR